MEELIMFIEKSDLEKKMMAHEITGITNDDEDLINHAISSAITEMKGYLKGRYDVAAIFAATGDDRSPLMVSFACDVAIYELVSLALPGQDLEDRRARYKRAIDWLKQLAHGDIQADLPLLADTEGITEGPFAFASQTKRNNSW